LFRRAEYQGKLTDAKCLDGAVKVAETVETAIRNKIYSSSTRMGCEIQVGVNGLMENRRLMQRMGKHTLSNANCHSQNGQENGDAETCFGSEHVKHY
jgi:hypothetical protein